MYITEEIRPRYYSNPAISVEILFEEFSVASPLALDANVALTCLTDRVYPHGLGAYSCIIKHEIRMR